VTLDFERVSPGLLTGFVRCQARQLFTRISAKTFRRTFAKSCKDLIDDCNKILTRCSHKCPREITEKSFTGFLHDHQKIFSAGHKIFSAGLEQDLFSRA
jgi:hypothetical protein